MVKVGVERPMRDKPPAEGSAVRRLARKAARAFKRCRDFALMVPLAAGIALAPACQPDPCRSHNETTQSLKREVDGKTATLKELENLSGTYPVAEPIIDFINETHAISSRAIPDDATITGVEDRCKFHSGGRKSYAYALMDSGYTYERGIYLVNTMDMSSISLIGVLPHEVGHLQSGKGDMGSEIISQLNSLEQYAMGFVVLLRQGASPDDLTRWAAHQESAGLAVSMDFFLTRLDSGEFSFDKADDYAKGLFFIYMKMLEHNGDFGKVRADVDSLARRGKLYHSLDQKTDEFASYYLDKTFPDISAATKALIYQNYLTRFGPEVAKQYIKFSSALVSSQPSIGLEGTACESIGEITKKDYEPCTDELCESTGAARKISVSARLCCVGVDADNPELVKYVISASGSRYEGTLTVGGYEWYGMNAWTSTDSSERIGKDESCF